MSLSNKQILITAGPTCVHLDPVRVLTNIASGQSGVFLATQLAKKGAHITLLHADSVNLDSLAAGIKKIPFNTFDQLEQHLARILKIRKFDIIIHSAAVSDYKPLRCFSSKINSKAKTLTITFTKTPKLIRNIRIIQPQAQLVGFKLVTSGSFKSLIKIGSNFLKEAKLDWCVANKVFDAKYEAVIVSRNEILGPFKNKRNTLRALQSALGGK